MDNWIMAMDVIRESQEFGGGKFSLTPVSVPGTNILSTHRTALDIWPINFMPNLALHPPARGENYILSLHPIAKVHCRLLFYFLLALNPFGAFPLDIIIEYIC